MAGFFNKLGFGGNYARGTNRSKFGPVPPDPEDAARYFQPLEIEKDDEKSVSPTEARQRREKRLLRPRALRRLHAAAWVTGRKISRLHRAVPLPVVALFYLLVAGAVCYLAARPLLEPPPRPTELVELPPPAKPELPEVVAQISERIKVRDFAGATALVNALEADHPDDARVIMTKGAVFAGERKYPEARAAFQKALELSPNSGAAMMNLAEIDFVMGNFEDARSRYRELLFAQAKSPLVVFRLYLCAKQLHKPEEATTFLQHPLIGPQSLEWYYMNAAEEFYAGKPEAAKQTVERARLLFGEKTKPYDKTFSRIGILPAGAGE